jgi:hypothetical protein
MVRASSKEEMLRNLKATLEEILGQWRKQG